MGPSKAGEWVGLKRLEGNSPLVFVRYLVKSARILGFKRHLTRAFFADH